MGSQFPIIVESSLNVHTNCDPIKWPDFCAGNPTPFIVFLLICQKTYTRVWLNISGIVIDTVGIAEHTTFLRTVRLIWSPFSEQVKCNWLCVSSHYTPDTFTDKFVIIIRSF